METALITLATAIVTGGVALLGVYLSSKANIERLKHQLAHESNEKKRALNRQMAEDLYGLTEEWLNGLFSNYLSLSFVMQGKFDYNQHFDQIIEYGKKNKSNFSRLEMILNIYFPELLPAYVEVTKARSLINDISTQHKRAFEQGEDVKHFLKPFTSAQIKLEEYGDKFKEEIARVARNA